MSHRKGNKSVLFEEVIQQALDAIRSGKVRSAYAAKKKFDVGRALLCRRLNGSQQSRAQAGESQQLLTIPEGGCSSCLVSSAYSHWVSSKA